MDVFAHLLSKGLRLLLGLHASGTTGGAGRGCSGAGIGPMGPTGPEAPRTWRGHGSTNCWGHLAISVGSLYKTIQFFAGVIEIMGRGYKWNNQEEEGCNSTKKSRKHVGNSSGFEFWTIKIGYFSKKSKDKKSTKMQPPTARQCHQQTHNYMLGHPSSLNMFENSLPCALVLSVKW